jgi:hypothetical protein
MSNAIKYHVELDGPFFQGDPGQKLGARIRQMHSGLAQEGQRLVRQALQAGQSGRQPMRGVSPNRVAEHVIGRVESLTGKGWRASAVISVNNSGLSARGGISLMAAASLLEGRFHPFRRTALALGRSRAVLSANLTRDIN